MKFDDSIWVISTVKGREKKRKEKVTYWGWGVVAGKIRKHQPGRTAKKSSDQSRVNECFKKMGRLGGKC